MMNSRYTVNQGPFLFFHKKENTSSPSHLTDVRQRKETGEFFWLLRKV